MILFKTSELIVPNTVYYAQIMVAIHNYPVIIPTSPKMVFIGRIFTVFCLNCFVY